MSRKDEATIAAVARAVGVGWETVKSWENGQAIPIARNLSAYLSHARASSEQKARIMALAGYSLPPEQAAHAPPERAETDAALEALLLPVIPPGRLRDAPAVAEALRGAADVLQAAEPDARRAAVALLLDLAASLRVAGQPTTPGRLLAALALRSTGSDIGSP